MVVYYRGKPIATLDDISLEGKRVLVRLDLNSPIDSNTGKILDDSRIREASKSLRELIERGAGVAILSHQGRPLEDDFVSLEEHAEILSKISGVNVEFLMDVIGIESSRRLSRLAPGEAVLLDNSRIVSEDFIEAEPQVHANSLMVKRLSKHFDYFVNDAFSASHRSHASIVGFPMVMPSAAGILVENELRALNRALETGERPRIFVVGGAKIGDAVKLIDYLTATGAADEILTTGLVSLLFLKASGAKLPRGVEGLLARKGGEEAVKKAERLIAEGRPVRVPIDFLVEADGRVYIEYSRSLRGMPKDVGPSTLEYYRAKISKAKVVVMRGPAGVIEDSRFRRGTLELVKAALESKAFTVFGGGHFRTILSGLSDELKRSAGHISTGGGALLYFLSGRPLPGLEALSMSNERFKLAGG